MKWLCLFLLAIVIPCNAVQASALYSSVRKGVDLYESEQYEEALKKFLDAQVENPESSVLKFDIASCQYKLHKYEEAAAGYLDVVATARDAELEAQALYNIGNTMYRQGKLEEAVEYYKKALELDPEDEDARKNLEFVREEIKRRMNEARETQKRQKEGQKDQQGQQDQQEQQNQQGQQDQQEQQNQQGQQDQQDQQEQQNQQGQQDQQGQQNQQSQQDQQESEKQSAQKSPQGSAGQAGQKDAQQAEDDLRDITGSARPMSAEEAEQLLRGLEENRDKLQEFRRQSQPSQRRRPEKDW